MLTEEEARKQLVDVMKILHERGLINVKGGNASIKLNDFFIITPSGIPKHKLKPEFMVKVYMDGTWKGMYKPSIEYLMHLEIYKERPDIKAIIHSHNPITVIAVELGLELNPKEYVETQYAVGECITKVEPLPPGTLVLAKKVAKAIRECNICILRKHGVVAVSSDIYSALDTLEALEDLAKMTIYKHLFSFLKNINKQSN